MLTTEGSTCLAIWLNVFDSSTGLGITSGVAPGAAGLSLLAALTPWLISVPMTMPILSVNRIRSECIRQFHRVGNHQRGCPRRRRIIAPGRLDALVDQRPDDYANTQREQNQGERKHLLCT